MDTIAARELTDRLPREPAFHGLAQHQKKACAQSFIASILDAIERQGREPDQWEARDLNSALGSIASGMYTASIAYADHALTEVDRRGTELFSRSTGEMPTLQALRNGLQLVTALAARVD